MANDEAAGATTENPSVGISNLRTDGAEWVELFVREMRSAISVDDARARAAKVLEVLENPSLIDQIVVVQDELLIELVSKL